MDLYLKSRKDSGIMWGSYDFISDLDGRTFSAHIPKFDLTPTRVRRTFRFSESASECKCVCREVHLSALKCTYGVS